MRLILLAVWSLCLWATAHAQFNILQYGAKPNDPSREYSTLFSFPISPLIPSDFCLQT
jgi:hypothetical protein